mgnify:CR=1 FL=1
MATGTPAGAGLVQIAGPVPLVDWLVVVPLALPLLAAGVCLMLRSRNDLQAPIAIGALALLVLNNLALLARVAADGPLVMTMGNWLPPFGITFAVDLLSAVLLLSASAAGLAGAVASLADIGEAYRRHGYFSFFLLLVAGVSGSFATGDIFNLYVWFEVFLIASFGLIVLGGEARQLDGAVKYGVLNFLATTLFLIAIAYLYGLVGTLNMADIPQAVARLEASAPIATVTALFVLAFAMKAAAFPVHAWLPASYHTPRIVVAAIFGGLLTKVGVYALLRIVVMLVAVPFAGFQPAMAWIAGLTALFGALAALAERDVRRVLGFVVISGIGVMLVGIAVGGEQGLSGTIVYVVHSMFATTAIYLTVGAMERAVGGRDLAAGAGIFRDRALLAGLFLVFAFALAGLPPFSGVWPKVILIEASLAAGNPWLAAVVVVSGFLTTVALARIWILVVLRNPRAAPAAGEGLAAAGLAAATASGGASGRAGGRAETASTAALVALAVVVVGLGLFPAPLIDAASDGAATLVDPSGYARSVLGGPQ